VRHFIPLRTKKGFKTKTGKARLVPLEHAVWLELESLKPIVAMPATAPVDPGADITTAVSADYVLTGSAHERLEESFRRLGTWMTGLGFNRKKKAHELRKHFGSAAADQLGDRIAPKLLGNSADVFHAHYDAMRVTPEVKMFQAG
jgi:integrase